MNLYLPKVGSLKTVGQCWLVAVALPIECVLSENLPLPRDFRENLNNARPNMHVPQINLPG